MVIVEFISSVKYPSIGRKTWNIVQLANIPSHYDDYILLSLEAVIITAYSWLISFTCRL